MPIFDLLVPIVHVTACMFLIVVVLLQSGKGADMGAVFGGASTQTLFGSTGAGNVLTKLTTGMAVTFMCTSLILAMAARERPSSDLLRRLPEAAAPAIPAPAPVAPPAAPEATTDGAAPAAAPAPTPDDTAAADAATDEAPATN